MKRSSVRYCAVIPGELTRNEQRDLEEQGIEIMDMSLEEFVEQLTETAEVVLGVG